MSDTERPGKPRSLGQALSEVMALQKDPPRPKRRISGMRALEYRKGGRRFQRCSRCHVERDLSAPMLRDGSDQLISPEQTMAVVMVGNIMLGFICQGCEYATCKHMAALFPNEQGLPFVDKRGQLLPPPRCNDCGQLLEFAEDGIHVTCPVCDVPEQSFHGSGGVD